jgi:hypothetical protein
VLDNANTSDAASGDGQPQTIIGALCSDHRAIQALLADPVALEHDEDGLTAREEIVIELVRHLVAEEQYLYPTVRDHVSGGGDIADLGFAAGRSCEAALRPLEDDALTAAQTVAALDEVSRLFALHITAQEDTVFPVLERDLDPELLIELGDGVRGAEQLAPTRPRHVAFAAAGLSKVSSFVTGYIDHVRDYYSRRGVPAEADQA